MILGLTLIAIGVFLMTLSFWSIPSVRVGSWGEPDPKIIRAWSILMCFSFLFGGLIVFIGIDTLVGGH